MSSTARVVVILDNIRSVHNAGSIFRTADAAGVAHIYCTGVTPTPIDRFGRERKDFIKSALGAEKSVSWSYEKDAQALVQRLKSEGVLIVSLEQSPRSVSYKTALAGDRAVALVLGSETSGVDPAILELSDYVFEIPMRGTKESLNVSVAAGIALFAITSGPR